MNYAAVLSVLAMLLMLFSIPLGISAGVGFLYGEHLGGLFLSMAGGCLVAGGALFLVMRRFDLTVRVREGFFITSLTYLVLGLLASVPFQLGDEPIASSFTDAVFESFAGLTTTGASVLVGLDEMPRAILFFRSMLQWVGGMGIIVLAVAILPMLGVGGMQLFRAEATGTINDTSLKPRITEAAKTLWMLYLSLTLTCALAYWLAGMGLFDAVCHSFTTVAIGGFSNYDTSIGFFNEPMIEIIAIVFMVLAGFNFTLHYAAVRKMQIGIYFRDREARTYVIVLLVVVAIVFVRLSIDGDTATSPLREGIFQAVSFATTTGYTTTNVDAWPLLCPIVLILASFAGGCVGSTAGGMKIYRILVIMQQSVREVRRLILPDGVFQVKLGTEIVPDRVIEAVWGFVTMYGILFFVLLISVLTVSDLDIKSAFSAVAACLNNLGPGIGAVSEGYGNLNNPTKWLLILAMVLGRLEIFTLLVLLAPRYWRR